MGANHIHVAQHLRVYQPMLATHIHISQQGIPKERGAIHKTSTIVRPADAFMRPSYPPLTRAATHEPVTTSQGSSESSPGSARLPLSRNLSRRPPPSLPHGQPGPGRPCRRLGLDNGEVTLHRLRVSPEPALVRRRSSLPTCRRWTRAYRLSRRKAADQGTRPAPRRRQTASSSFFALRAEQAG